MATRSIQEQITAATERLAKLKAREMLAEQRSKQRQELANAKQTRTARFSWAARSSPLGLIHWMRLSLLAYYLGIESTSQSRPSFNNEMRCARAGECI